jgi:YhcH/YjgK/YiaL family protein
MAIFGSISTVRAQTERLTWLQPAFVYLDELFKPESAAHQNIKSLAPGKTFRRELLGGIFVLEQAYLTKARTEGRYESHRRLLDIQVIFEGEEIMELAGIAGLTVRDPYVPERDIAFYDDVLNGSALRARAGDAAVFFPADGHKPGLLIDSPRFVRKAVVKIPLPV